MLEAPSDAVCLLLQTAENFRQLCTGEAGVHARWGGPLLQGMPLPQDYQVQPVPCLCVCYQQLLTACWCRDFMIQGGDFTRQNGT